MKDTFASINGDGSIIPMFDTVSLLLMSKRMISLTRHVVSLRDQDGGVYWRTSILDVHEFCDQKNQVKYMRSIQGHSGGVHIVPKLQNNVRIPYGLTDYIYHVGSALNSRFISEGGLIAGRIGVQQRRKTCFFTAWNPPEQFDTHSSRGRRQAKDAFLTN